MVVDLGWEWFIKQPTEASIKKLVKKVNEYIAMYS